MKFYIQSFAGSFFLMYKSADGRIETVARYSIKELADFYRSGEIIL